MVYDRGEQVGEYRAIIEAEISEDKYKVYFLDSNLHAWPVAKEKIKTIDDGAPRTSPTGHRPYLGAHTKNSMIKRRGCDDDGCVRSDLDAIWPCSYCNFVWHATCACEFDDGEAIIRPN